VAARRVLIVDDEPLLTMLVQDWLEQLGYEALGPARDVAQALALIEQGNPAAAILDVSLKGGDSYPVADALVARRIPFAFATGRDERAIDARHAGAPVLAKPFELRSLEATLAGLLP
jgi:DNA-binding response OmpR family regulator